MLPLAADEAVRGAIIRGLRRREPNIDLVLAQEAAGGQHRKRPHLAGRAALLIFRPS